MKGMGKFEVGQEKETDTTIVKFLFILIFKA